MKVWLPLLLCAALIATVPGCRKAENSPIPYIELISLSPDSVKALSPLDTVYITFNFSDGDGDLGRDIVKQEYDFFLKDSRDPKIDTLRFPFPEIPDEARDPIDGIRGSGAIALVGSRIQVREDTVHKFKGDTLTYQMWIVDRANHQSNVVTTPPIYIHP